MNVRRPTEADAAAVTDLIAAFETNFIGEPEMRTPDLLDDWRDLDLAKDTWLVELDGRLAGYAALLTKPHVSSTPTSIRKPRDAESGPGWRS